MKIKFCVFVLALFAFSVTTMVHGEQVLRCTFNDGGEGATLTGQRCGCRAAHPRTQRCAAPLGFCWCVHSALSRPF